MRLPASAPPASLTIWRRRNVMWPFRQYRAMPKKGWGPWPLCLPVKTSLLMRPTLARWARTKAVWTLLIRRLSRPAAGLSMCLLTRWSLLSCFPEDCCADPVCFWKTPKAFTIIWLFINLRKSQRLFQQQKTANLCVIIWMCLWMRMVRRLNATATTALWILNRWVSMSDFGFLML